MDLVTIRVKTGAVGGGSWRAPTADGDIRLKWGGTAWKYPAMIRVKDGGVGGGVWRDSGYRGYPNEPRGLNVDVWDNTNFDNISVDWALPVAGGAPVHHYEVQMLNASGGLRATKTPSAPPTSGFAVDENDKIQFRVRSVTAAGLVSDWTTYLRVLMGHKEQGHYRAENRTRSWFEQVNGPWWDNAYIGGETVVRVPDAVTVRKLHYDLRAQGAFTSVLSPYGNREIRSVRYSVDKEIMNMGAPYTVVDGGWDHDGDSAHPWWGIRLHGIGWSGDAGGAYKVLGTFGVEGVETYQVQVYVVDVAYRANSYW